MLGKEHFMEIKKDFPHQRAILAWGLVDWKLQTWANLVEWSLYKEEDRKEIHKNMLHPRSAIFVSWDEADFIPYMPLLCMIHGGSKCAASPTGTFVVLCRSNSCPICQPCCYVILPLGTHDNGKKIKIPCPRLLCGEGTACGTVCRITKQGTYPLVHGESHSWSHHNWQKICTSLPFPLLWYRTDPLFVWC